MNMETHTHICMYIYKGYVEDQPTELDKRHCFYQIIRLVCFHGQDHCRGKVFLSGELRFRKFTRLPMVIKPIKSTSKFQTQIILS